MLNHNNCLITRNLKGTTNYKLSGEKVKRRRCRCGSWIEHWRKFTGGKRVTCAVIGCNNLAKCGAHVVSTDGRRDQQWWIVPVCSNCNHYRNIKEMKIDRRSWLVSANMWLTCKNDRK